MEVAAAQAWGGNLHILYAGRSTHRAQESASALSVRMRISGKGTETEMVLQRGTQPPLRAQYELYECYEIFTSVAKLELGRGACIKSMTSLIGLVEDDGAEMEPEDIAHVKLCSPLQFTCASWMIISSLGKIVSFSRLFPISHFHTLSTSSIPRALLSRHSAPVQQDTTIVLLKTVQDVVGGQLRLWVWRPDSREHWYRYNGHTVCTSLQPSRPGSRKHSTCSTSKR